MAQYQLKPVQTISHIRSHWMKIFPENLAICEIHWAGHKMKSFVLFEMFHFALSVVCISCCCFLYSRRKNFFVSTWRAIEPERESWSNLCSMLYFYSCFSFITIIIRLLIFFLALVTSLLWLWQFYIRFSSPGSYMYVDEVCSL